MKIRNGLAALAALLLAACGGGAGGDGNQQAGQSSGTGTQAAAATGCDRFFPDGKAPVVANPKANEGAQRLCFRSYTSYYSPKSRTPLWSAEVLTEAGVQMAHDVVRVDNFHIDPTLRGDQPQLSDYVHSGYDRGHMTPNGDMPSTDAAFESFDLAANVVPQSARLNRGSWERLESSVRRQTRNGNDVYVVTGPLFLPRDGRLHTTHTDGRLIIPSHTWKCIYVPLKGATCFTATNDDEPVWNNMSVAQFTDAYGINPFPGMPDKFRSVNAAVDGSLTMPKGGKNGPGGRNGNGGGNGGNGDPYANVTIRDKQTGMIETIDMYRNGHNGADPLPEEIEH